MTCLENVAALKPPQETLHPCSILSAYRQLQKNHNQQHQLAEAHHEKLKKLHKMFHNKKAIWGKMARRW